MLPLWGQAHIYLDRVPANTPHDASFYLAADFNNWAAEPTAYRFQALADGSYVLRLPDAPSRFKYKITRGNWSSVEGRPSGQARVNRLFDAALQGPEVHVIIESWEDLEGSLFSGYTFFLLLSAFQAILLIIALNTIQDNNTRANLRLSLLLLLMAFALVGRVAMYDRDWFTAWPKLLLLPELILFIWGPLFYYYICRLLKLPDRIGWPRWAHIVPFLLQIGWYLQFFFQDSELFREQVVNEQVHATFGVVGGLAWGFNLFYWWQVRQLIWDYEHRAAQNRSSDQNLDYLYGVMVVQAICLGIWFLTYFVSGLGWVMNWDVIWFREKSTDTAWGVFAITAFAMGYYAMNHPEIFKLPKVVAKYKDDRMSSNELDRYKGRLLSLMEENKAFKQPDLTLAQLAEMATTNTHTLSRVINEGFGKSFYDFINKYRVDEFTQLALSEAGRKETFLALAMEAGFNSKTTFNRAFKKVTGTTPRAYLKEREQQDESATSA